MLLLVNQQTFQVPSCLLIPSLLTLSHFFSLSLRYSIQQNQMQQVGLLPIRLVFFITATATSRNSLFTGSIYLLGDTKPTSMRRHLVLTTRDTRITPPITSRPFKEGGVDR
jgi:hypothetical protein